MLEGKVDSKFGKLEKAARRSMSHGLIPATRCLLLVLCSVSHE